MLYAWLQMRQCWLVDFVWFLVIAALLLLVAAVRFDQRRRRGQSVAVLTSAVRELGFAVGNDNIAWQLRDIADGHVCFENGERELRIDALRLLEIMENHDEAHRRMPLRLLWSRAETADPP